MRKVLCIGLTALVLILAACGSQSTVSADAWQEQYDLGVRYLSEGNYEEAIIAFSAAIEIDPKRPEAYVALANAYIKVEDYSKANEVITQARETCGLEGMFEATFAELESLISRAETKKTALQSLKEAGLDGKIVDCELTIFSNRDVPEYEAAYQASGIYGIMPFGVRFASTIPVEWGPATEIAEAELDYISKYNALSWEQLCGPGSTPENGEDRGGEYADIPLHVVGVLSYHRDFSGVYHGSNGFDYYQSNGPYSFCVLEFEKVETESQSLKKDTDENGANSPRLGEAQLTEEDALNVAKELIAKYETYTNKGIACDLDWESIAPEENAAVWAMLSETQKEYLMDVEKCVCCKTYEQAVNHTSNCIDVSILNYITQDYVEYNDALYFFAGGKGSIYYQNVSLSAFDNNKIIATADCFNSGDDYCGTEKFEIYKENQYKIYRVLSL